MGKSLKKFSAYKNYFFRLLVILILFVLLYRIIYPSHIWGQTLFFFVNIISDGLFNNYIDRMACCYFTLATGLICCFLSQILFSVLKFAYSRLKGYRRK
ncbi:TPA: hypothetical protein I9080_001649 [Clostridium perfringens]|uniref:Uncharacterized protein n=1 Tax=Clostridium perfringens TaxID=1502 RepID=A0A8H9QZ72_CLOPF|nr:hypothetical protein [Clostridium perfringens]HAT4307857.1 hypothetical protein [Clostridium perfringens]